MLKIVQIIITLLIIASLILQILVLLGNFSGLRNVNIIRVELTKQASSNGLFGGILDSIKKTVDDNIPDYVTIGLFVICEGNNGTAPLCSPPSFGFNYNSTGILNTLQGQIPSSFHSALSGVQKGVFIVSAVICFILMCYNIYHQYTVHKRGCCRMFLIFTIAIIALLFCIATFVVQIVAYNLVKSEINKALDSFFGSELVNSLVKITTKAGPSIWFSLAGFISLFLSCLLLLISACCLRPKKRDESYEMESIA